MSTSKLSALLGAALLAGGCSLTDSTIADVEPTVVVEAFARIDPAGGGTVFALLHGSVGVVGAPPGGPEALVRVRTDGGSSIDLLEAGDPTCLYGSAPEPDPSRCYAAALPQTFAGPSDRLTLEVTLSDGGMIEGGTIIPGSFDWSGPTGLTDEPGTCAIATGEVEVRWTPSDETWAYIADVMLYGVAAPLAELGVPNAVDSVSLFGVAVSRADTAVSFPNEFSVDDDLDYEAPLIEVLEAGIRPDMLARASVMAIDRNFTNWIRDPVFNPSGTVRIPSLRGDGTGVFGSSVVLEGFVAGSPAECPPPP